MSSGGEAYPQTMYAYCLFCDARRADTIVKYLEKREFDCAFSPKVTINERKNGVNQKKMRDLLPGYIFAFSEEKITDVAKVLNINGAIRFLSTDGGGYLTHYDKVFAEKLLECKGVINTIRLIQIGDVVSINNEIFEGCKAKVIKVDYRKERAKIEFKFAKMTCCSWVACEVIRCCSVDSTK